MSASIAVDRTCPRQCDRSADRGEPVDPAPIGTAVSTAVPLRRRGLRDRHPRAAPKSPHARVVGGRATDGRRPWGHRRRVLDGRTAVVERVRGSTRSIAAIACRIPGRARSHVARRRHVGAEQSCRIRSDEPRRASQRATALGAGPAKVAPCGGMPRRGTAGRGGITVGSDRSAQTSSTRNSPLGISIGRRARRVSVRGRS